MNRSRISALYVPMLLAGYLAVTCIVAAIALVVVAFVIRPQATGLFVGGLLVGVVVSNLLRRKHPSLSGLSKFFAHQGAT